ncbi:hypothetical protein Hanom_Chr03g00194591 [Helianthus anomalus]
MSLIKEFWNSANVIEVDGKEPIQGQVNQLNVDVSPDILNSILELQDDANAPDSIQIMCTCGCLHRMKCTGDIFAGQINKAKLPLQYKFLHHVLIQCVSNSRAGYDMAGNDLVGLMVALVLNKPFSISKFIFANMKENLRRKGSRTSGNKFWMYSRFMQMIMNVQHTNLPKADNDILNMMLCKGFSSKRYIESDPPRKMFGALDNTEYVTPANDKWRHDDIQSDDEEPKLKKMMEDKFGRKKLDPSESDSDSDDESGDGGDTGAIGASAASTPGASSARGDEENSDSENNELEPGYEFYLDGHGVRKVRNVRQEEDADYVPSDTEAKRVKKKEVAAQRKRKI